MNKSIPRMFLKKSGILTSLKNFHIVFHNKKLKDISVEYDE